MKRKNFVIAGVAGYIAPRHLAVIKDIKGELIASYDINDSVGIIDKYFPNSLFFKKHSNFEKFIRLNKKKIDYFVICLPNYLHFKYISLAVQNDINVICEKPLVTNLSQLNILKKIKKNKTSINCIMQLRFNKEVLRLKNYVQRSKKNYFEVKMNYFTRRGDWFFKSWKGQPEKSGGLAMNIGIHIFDILFWIFGKYIKLEILKKDNSEVRGILYLKKAKIFLNISVLQKFKTRKVQRQIKIDNNIFEFSKNFENLHKKSYQEIFKGHGFGLDDVKNGIFITNKIKNEKK